MPRLRITHVLIGALAVFAMTTSIVPRLVAASSSGGWLIKCDLSHSLPDDPIAHPGVPGASHLHDFFGNSSTNAFSTYQSEQAATTNCGTPQDLAGYWTPALYRDGVKINPTGGSTRQQIYYRANNLNAGTVIEPFPADFRLIAGVSTATSLAQNPEIGHEIYWGCSDNSESGKPTEPLASCSTGIITLHIGFPNCWDGVQTHTNDTSHVVYPSGGVCPADHSHALPRIIERLEYPVGTVTETITLSSGGGNAQTGGGSIYSAHADFWNTWRQDALQYLVANCLNANVDCGTNPVLPSTLPAPSPTPVALTPTPTPTPIPPPSPAPPPVSGFGRVGTVGTTAGANASTATIVVGGVAAGHSMLISALLTNVDEDGTFSATDSAGNPYSVDANISDGSAGDRALILSSLNVRGLAAGQTITVRFPPTGQFYVRVEDFVGLSARDRTAGQFGTGVSFNSGNTAPTASAQELLYGTVGVESGQTPAWASGWSGLPALWNQHDYLSAAYRVASAPGQFAATGNCGGTWMGAIATYR